MPSKYCSSSSTQPKGVSSLRNGSTSSHSDCAGNQKLASSRARHLTANIHSNTKSTTLTSRGNQVLRRAEVDMESFKAPIVELKPFEGVDSGPAKLLDAESKFAEEDDEMEGEVPPQIIVRGRGAGAAPLKSEMEEYFLTKRYMQDSIPAKIDLVNEKEMLLKNSDSQENITEITRL